MIAALALLRRVPSLAWFVLAVLSVAIGLLAYGEHRGAAKVHAAAVRDSAVHQRARVDTAVHRSDSVVAVAEKAVVISTRGRAHTRAVLEAARDSIPPTVLEVASEQLAHDSVTIAVQAAAIDTLITERGVRIQLDSLQARELEVFKPPGGFSVGEAVKDVAIVALVVEAVRLLLQLLHR